MTYVKFYNLKVSAKERTNGGARHVVKGECEQAGYLCKISFEKGKGELTLSFEKEGITLHEVIQKHFFDNTPKPRGIINRDSEGFFVQGYEDLKLEGYVTLDISSSDLAEAGRKWDEIEYLKENRSIANQLLAIGEAIKMPSHICQYLRREFPVQGCRQKKRAE